MASAAASVSFPEDLKKILDLEAKDQNRSFSQQVVFILKKHYPEQAKPDEVINQKPEPHQTTNH